MKNTFGSDLSLTIFGESTAGPSARCWTAWRRACPWRKLSCCLHGQAPCPGRRPFHPPCGGGCGAVFVRCGQRLHHWHRHCLMIENQNTRSGDYAKTADLLRPGHADYTAYAKYHGYQDARGGRPLFGPRHRRAGGGRRFGAGRSEPGRDRDRDAHRAVCRDRRYPLCVG